MEEVDLISSVPLSAFGANDRLTWRKTNTCQYNVASGYEFARSIKRQKKGG